MKIMKKLISATVVLVIVAMPVLVLAEESVVTEETIVSTLQTTPCITPNELGDSVIEQIQTGWENLSLQQVFDSQDIDLDVMNDQRQYQSWDVAVNKIVNVQLTFVSRHGSADNSVFGFY